MTLVDDIFDDPRLAAMSDPFDPDRSDLDVYVAIAGELARRACWTSAAGPAPSRSCWPTGPGGDGRRSGEGVARRRARQAGSRRVSWIHGDASALPALQVDLATMTGNAAQAIVDERHVGPHAARRLRHAAPGRALRARDRDPEYEAWREWTRDASYEISEIDGVGPVENWAELTAVELPLVTFRWTLVFPRRGRVDIRLDAALPRAGRGARRPDDARLRRGRRPRCAGPTGPRAGLPRTPSGLIATRS